PAGTTVKMRCGERLKDDGTLETSQIDVFVKKYGNEQFQEDRYTFKGDGVETWHPRFTYHGFQYVEVAGFPGKPTAENPRGRVVHPGLEPARKFESLNPL